MKIMYGIETLKDGIPNANSDCVILKKLKNEKNLYHIYRFNSNMYNSKSNKINI
jgi:hypothetical protein